MPLRLQTFVETLSLEVCLMLIQERQDTAQTGELGPTTRQVLRDFVPRSRAPELKAGGWAGTLVEAVLFDILRRTQILPSPGRPSLIGQLAEVRALAQHVELQAAHQRAQQQDEQRARQAVQLLVQAALNLPDLNWP
ncbi:hypothetical protein [Deinococcus sp. Leaf326]|uniref:hypothetical protein n=1 Tax=Deinococcus sp. Leaf326 TaxID=1736338 RepID=UPI0012E11ED8|nr:hypothetical protein [Deinococcus sp. Leaf326]